jgi:hypothetical protein
MRFKVMFSITGILLTLAGIALSIFSYSRLASGVTDDYGKLMSFVGSLAIFFLGLVALVIRKVETSETRSDLFFIYGFCIMFFGGISMLAGFVPFDALPTHNLFMGLGAVQLLFGFALVFLSITVRSRRV